ncbi:hypothetical protein PISMIDRAFT_329579 [Pisolithus microcarpus 441]|uniref:Uncharacterized protein n=1 Tax=Pisolithus microcarpus 441 TaxID=765257 RepID=A0A0C9YFD9_9AGAM|nr:hypothetical protein PISMIDRAFT_329579 [Pisolithus microcarpus 441]
MESNTDIIAEVLVRKAWFSMSLLDIFIPPSMVFTVLAHRVFHQTCKGISPNLRRCVDRWMRSTAQVVTGRQEGAQLDDTVTRNRFVLDMSPVRMLTVQEHRLSYLLHLACMSPTLRSVNHPCHF